MIFHIPDLCTNKKYKIRVYMDQDISVKIDINFLTIFMRVIAGKHNFSSKKSLHQGL